MLYRTLVGNTCELTVSIRDTKGYAVSGTLVASVKLNGVVVATPTVTQVRPGLYSLRFAPDVVGTYAVRLSCDDPAVAYENTIESRPGPYTGKITDDPLFG